MADYEVIREDGMNIQIKQIDGDFSVCKVTDYSQVNLDAQYCFLGKTDEENSLVCLTEDVPNNVAVRDDGWKAFRIQGVLDFSLIGILAEISTLLAESRIGIFAVSKYSLQGTTRRPRNGLLTTNGAMLPARGIAPVCCGGIQRGQRPIWHTTLRSKV